VTDTSWEQVIERRLFQLAGDSPMLAEDASGWFLQQGAAVADRLVAALDDTQLGSIGHWRILRILSALALPATLPGVLAALERARRQRDNSVLPGAMEALAAIGTPEAVAALVDLLAEGNRDTALHAAILLGSTADPGAIEPLLARLASPDAGMRYVAAQSLLNFADPAVHAALARQLLTETDPDVRTLLSGAGYGSPSS
jgi:HEAT repeat protein